MEIIIALIILWLICLSVITGIEMVNLKSTVKKQQEQIDLLNTKCNQLAGICNDITTGVISELTPISSDLKEIREFINKKVREKSI